MNNKLNYGLKENKTMLKNLMKLGRMGYSSPRMVVSKKGGAYYIVKGVYGEFDLLNALTLEKCGSLRYNINNKNRKLATVVTLRVKERGIGLGTALMQYAENQFKKQGVKQIRLLASRSRANSPHEKLLEFYTKLGYKRTHRYSYIAEPMLKTKTRYYKPNITSLREVISEENIKKLTPHKNSIIKVVSGQATIEKALNKKMV